MRYVTSEFFLDDMGTMPPFVVEDGGLESKEEELLWHINDMRKHDYLPPLDELPNVEITFTRIQDES